MGAPAVVSRAENIVDVYVRGCDRALYQRHWDSGAGWGDWFLVDSRPLDSAPGVVSEGPAREVVFARIGNQLYAKTWNSGSPWGPWTPFGAVALPPPPAPPAPPPPDGNVGLRIGLRCTPPGGRLRVHITVRKRKGHRKPHVLRVRFFIRHGPHKTDRRAPYVVHLRIRRPAGFVGRVYARVYFKRTKHGPLHKKTVSRRFRVCG
jgi:hypothetical protein